MLQGTGCLRGVRTYLPGTVCRCAGGLSSVGIYLQGTVLQGSKLFKGCQKLSAGHCVAGMQAPEAVLEPSYGALYCRGADC